MNYPIWELSKLGGGLLIALVSVAHVYVAHFAIGGGLFLVLTELKGYRENSEDILNYTKRHALFFLLLTMVFGGMTGVGIWFTIALISPAATSVLIHNFVFGWATEWVCFVVEIVALFIYYYTFFKMEKRDHLRIGWLYFAFAWLSLFFINGIIGFMLTPGNWSLTGNFWHGFFNPTFWPSLCFRTALALVLAGLFGFVTASFLKADAFRQHMMKYCAGWVLAPFIFMLIFALWYYKALPLEPKAMIAGFSPEIRTYTTVFFCVLPVLFVGGLFMAVRMPKRMQQLVAFLLLFTGLSYMGSFEWIRESGRRPYLIYGYLYSNSIFVDQEASVNQKGILKTAKWVKNRKITAANKLAAGQEIFKLQCSACHSIGGPLNDILPLTAKYTLEGMDSQLSGQGKLNAYMPIFMGTKKEQKALAAYIVTSLHGKKEEAVEVQIEQSEVPIPLFDAEKDGYVVLAWDPFGMHYLFDAGPYWSLTTPDSRVYAQLIKRGELPEIMTDGVDISWRMEGSVPETGGVLEFDSDAGLFAAEHIPVSPYTKDNKFQPYPILVLEAKDKKTKQTLMTTRMTAPVSSEMGCKNCHGGNWRFGGLSGISDDTAKDVLAVHDRISKTKLAKNAENKKKDCRECHLEDDNRMLNLSAAIHGWHANYLSDRGADACHLCHPSSPLGATRFFRGQHSQNFECVECHGNMEDHALSLLKAEKEKGKTSADRLMKYLIPKTISSVEDINPRTPWDNEPDCLSCHIDFDINNSEDFSGFNKWTKSSDNLYRMRRDEMEAVKCQACHGSTHATFPAINPYGADRDNLQPLQYQKTRRTIGSAANCSVCHTINMEDSAHHPRTVVK